MKTRIFRQLDPRENRLPTDTSRIITVKPHRTIPLVNPDLFVNNHPGIKREIAKLDPVNPKTIRSDARERIHRMVEAANKMIRDSIHLKSIIFAVDDDSGRAVAVIKDKKTGQTIRQIPTEQTLNMAARLKESSGLLKDIQI